MAGDCEHTTEKDSQNAQEERATMWSTFEKDKSQNKSSFVCHKCFFVCIRVNLTSTLASVCFAPKSLRFSRSDWFETLRVFVFARTLLLSTCSSAFSLFPNLGFLFRRFLGHAFVLLLRLLIFVQHRSEHVSCAGSAETSAGKPPAPLLDHNGCTSSDPRNPPTIRAPSRLLVALGGALHPAAETRHFFQSQRKQFHLMLRAGKPYSSPPLTPSPSPTARSRKIAPKTVFGHAP